MEFFKAVGKSFKVAAAQRIAVVAPHLNRNVKNHGLVADRQP
jgi:hypothetical protein